LFTIHMDWLVVSSVVMMYKMNGLLVRDVFFKMTNTIGKSRLTA
jgi:hypothetical protein